MKKQTFLCVMLSLIMVSCGAPKQVVQKTAEPIEVNLPLSDAKYQSDENFFRERAVGKSPDMATAQKIAMTNAVTGMGGRIQTLLKSVRDNYTNQRTVGNKMEFENKFEELARLVVNQNLQDIGVVGEKAFKEPDGNYAFWVVIEISKNKVRDGLSNRISKDDKLSLDFDKFQYEKIFDKEQKEFKEQSL